MLFISHAIKVTIITTPPSGIGDLSLFWQSCLNPLLYLLQKLFKLFGFTTFRPWVYLMKVIVETCRAHYIEYLRCYYYLFGAIYNYSVFWVSRFSLEEMITLSIHIVLLTIFVGLFSKGFCVYPSCFCIVS